MSSSREQRKQLYERLIGTTISDRFVITDLIGFGGMGAVYEAIQRNMNRRIALKFIPSHNPTTAARFEREALTVSQLRHPNTVTVFDYGQTDDGFLFLTMEMLHGTTLTELIKQESPIDPKRAVHIATQMCRSLGEAHRMGIIHRDVKPDNVILINVDGDTDFVKVLDFGIAKLAQGEEDVQLTGDGRIIGTPRYMSPEQILAYNVDHRSDIYSLGCILFEMLCGAPPFLQTSTTALMISHTQDPPPPFAERLTEESIASIPRGLEHVVHKALAKSPDDRHQSMDELREDLEFALQKRQTLIGTQEAVLPSHSQHEPLDRAEASPRPPTPWALIAILGLCVTILGSAVFMLFLKKDPPPKPDPVAVNEPSSEPIAVEEIKPTAPEFLTLVIDSTPANAEVYQDAALLGRTPLELKVDNTDAVLRYRLSHEGYEDKHISLRPGTDTELPQDFSFALMPVEKQDSIKRPAPSAKKSGRSQPASAASKKGASPSSTASSSTSGDESIPQQPDSGSTTPKIDLIDEAPRPKVERL